MRVYKFQALRVLAAAQAAGDKRAETFTRFLLEDLQRGRNSDIAVASYARQISDETTSPEVQRLADDLAACTLGGDVWLRITHEMEAEPGG